MIRPPRAASTMAATMFLDYWVRVGRSVCAQPPALISRQVFWTMPAVP